MKTLGFHKSKNIFSSDTSMALPRGSSFYMLLKGALKNVRLGFEFATPLLQDVNGVQLKRKETLSAGIQDSF